MNTDGGSAVAHRFFIFFFLFIRSSYLCLFSIRYCVLLFILFIFTQRIIPEIKKSKYFTQFYSADFAPLALGLGCLFFFIYPSDLCRRSSPRFARSIFDIIQIEFVHLKMISF